MTRKLAEIGKLFRLEGKFYTYKVINNGNINSTYKVTFRQPDGKLKAYIIQKINTYVFRSPVEIMSNIDKVTTYMREKYPDQLNLHFHHTEDGKNYVFDEDGCFWRVMNYVDSMTFDTCDDLSVIEATGEAFGRFQMQLSDFDGAELFETIKDFHNTGKRLETLFSHVDEDPVERVALVQDEINYIASVRAMASEPWARFERGEFPVRVTHNDTKSNNVLFAKRTHKPLVVIDLDTVMPGMAMYDFADAVRFIANTAAEDEPDLDLVSFDVEKFAAFSRGFIGQVKNAFTPAEIDTLVPATFAITIELASRFLDDYITGDKYFKITYPEHNLVRTRCQLALARDIAKKYDELQKIVHSIAD